MPDPIPTPPADAPPTSPPLPPPTGLQRAFSYLLPQFINHSRKGLIWFSGLGVSGIAELAKSIGTWQGWDAAAIDRWQAKMLVIQGFVLFVAKMWTDQVTEEDKALKTGLPPPAQTITVQAVPSPREGD